MFFSMPKGTASVADIIARRSALAGLAVAITDTPGPGVVLRPEPPSVMLNLRGAADPAFRDAVRDNCGCELPMAANASNKSAHGSILKLGPNEWLLVASDGTAWSEELRIPGGTLTDVSHARIAIHVDGDESRKMLAKGCAIDLHPRQFPAGTCVQTSIAKIGVILHRPFDDNGYRLYAPRSYAGSFWHWLTAAANEYGYHVVTPQTGGDE